MLDARWVDWGGKPHSVELTRVDDSPVARHSVGDAHEQMVVAALKMADRIVHVGTQDELDALLADVGRPLRLGTTPAGTGPLVVRQLVLNALAGCERAACDRRVPSEVLRSIADGQPFASAAAALQNPNAPEDLLLDGAASVDHLVRTCVALNRVEPNHTHRRLARDQEPVVRGAVPCVRSPLATPASSRTCSKIRSCSSVDWRRCD
jgi:hypothetical protein